MESNMFRRGQGVVESVFAVGILALLLGGTIILLVMGISNRQKSFDRRKATELATIITENLIVSSQNDPEEFWKLTGVGVEVPESGFEGYTYSIGFTNVSNNSSYPNCGIGKTDCTEVVIGIGWSGKTPQFLYFNRFFSKND